MPESVRITDVAPRDGLQNEHGVIPAARKADLVLALCATGVAEVEVTSFVSPKWVPQLGDAAEVVALVARAIAKNSSALQPLLAPPLLSALVPNERGMQSLLDANDAARGEARAGPVIGKASVFTAASETFSRKNTGVSIGEALERFKPVLALARRAGLRTRGYVSCVIECPFEGPIAPERVAEVSAALADLGVDEIDLGDTIGKATPESTRRVLETYARRLPLATLTLHLHDTFGHAPACVLAALEMGVRSFDGSVAGLGGCPYASTTAPDGSLTRAPGNISSEALVAAVHQAGFATGVDLLALGRAAGLARDLVAQSRSPQAHS